MTRPISREDLIDQLVRAFSDESFVIAAWLGGSDASGLTDEHSDVDHQVIAEDDHVEACFGVLHRALEQLAPIELAHRLPEPTWHGFSQEFLRITGTNPDHFIDFVALPASTPPEKRLLEPERHGAPKVLFDRGAWLVVPPLDRA